MAEDLTDDDVRKFIKEFKIKKKEKDIKIKDVNIKKNKKDGNNPKK